jgi:hypothetical protein
VRVPEYVVDGEFWMKDHFAGEYLYHEKINLEAIPPCGDAARCPKLRFRTRPVSMGRPHRQRGSVTSTVSKLRDVTGFPIYVTSQKVAGGITARIFGMCWWNRLEVNPLWLCLPIHPGIPESAYEGRIRVPELLLSVGRLSGFHR